jgi:hypothetical protein
MRRSRWNTCWAVWIVAGCAATIGCGSQEAPRRGDILNNSTHPFDIFWPPIAPESSSGVGRQPLLRGDIAIRETPAGRSQRLLEIAVTITRPSDDDARNFWNSQLAFSDVPWMDEVRIWDAKSEWQWPNLPFLLRRHGLERIERYGGVDPGKRVDNDFAAVLIRSFDVSGKHEIPSSAASPLVSADWQGDSKGPTDIHSLVHVARSDSFEVHVGADDEDSSGLVKVWLIYADFLGSRAPDTWPKEREWAGGILSYCEIRWEKPAREPCRGAVRFMTPSASTGFNWEAWSEHSSPPAKPRLSYESALR